jgi:hypothetical protein
MAARIGLGGGIVVYLRVLVVPARLRARRAAASLRLASVVALSLWLGAGVIGGVATPLALGGRLGGPLLATVMAATLGPLLVTGAALSAVAYLLLLADEEGTAPVARHGAALSAAAALVCRAIAVPATEAAVRPATFAAAHAAAVALFGLALAAAALSLFALAASRRAAEALDRLP